MGCEIDIGEKNIKKFAYFSLNYLFNKHTIQNNFHCRQLKDVLHRCDRAMIYIFIAGSYFPWLTIHQLPEEGWSSLMRWLVWLGAAIGIGYQQAFHEKYKRLETIIYMIMGIGPSLPLITEVRSKGLSHNYLNL